MKTEEQIFRYRDSLDEFPNRLLFESRYFANKYREEKMPGLDSKYYMVTPDPFVRNNGFVIMLLTFV